MSKYISLVSILIAIISCVNTTSEAVQEVDYTNSRSLDSLINIHQTPNDTIFLGFRIGMSESEYNSHASQLKKEGKDIQFNRRFELSVPKIGNKNIGPGYVFKTPITGEMFDKPVTGNGTYHLKPLFINDKLEYLSITALEFWDGHTGNDTQWIEDNISNNSIECTDRKLIQALDDYDITTYDDFLRVKNNTFVFHSNMSTYNYASPSYLYKLIKDKVDKLDSIKSVKQDITF